MMKLNMADRKKYLVGLGVAFFGVVVSFQNCAKLDITDLDKSVPQVAAGTPVAPVVSSVNFNIEESAGFICSPFGTTTVPSDKSGLKAELRYVDQGSTLSTGTKNSFLSTQYFNDQDANFVKVPETVFLSNVNVPTRVFNTGFQAADGSFLQDNQGHQLIEYFALKMDSVLKLSSTDAEGYYELASIADDGSVVQIQEKGQWVTVINNDGAHSTRMGCMDRKILIDKNSRIPIRIYYNQGPREQIANVLVWNYRGPAVQLAPAVASDTAIHAYCGQASSDQFWTPATSQPNTWMNAVTSKGWKVVGTANFQLPDNEVNPCAYSSYDVAPDVSYNSISDLNKSITIASDEPTILTMNLYLIHDDGSKELVKTLVMPEDLTHTFETGTLLIGKKYVLDAVMEITNKKLKVLKSYNILVSAAQ